MKRVSKVFGLFLAIVFCMLTLSGKTLSAVKQVNGQPLFTAEEERLIAEMGEERFHRESRSCEAYSRLMRYFMETLGYADNHFPEYYGGAYLEDDGSLVINIRNDCEWAKKEIEPLVDGAEYQIKWVKYSLQLLYDTQTDLQELVVYSEDDALKCVYAFGTDEEAQKINVFMHEYSEEAQRIISDRVNKRGILRFIIDHREIEDHTNIYTGNQISGGSVGYRAQVISSSGVSIKGVMTAGHLVALNGYLYTQNNVAFAQCILRQNSGNADAAFCKITNASYTPVNTLSGHPDMTLSLYESNPPQSSTVYKLGLEEWGICQGSITSTNFSITVGNDYFYGLSTAYYTCAPGDSGGIVFSLSDTGVRYTVGIHKGKSGTNGIYSKAMAINSYFDASRY